MKRREAFLSLSVAALVLMALLTVFAIELSNTQAKSKQDVEARVHERAVLAGALIDSLFNTAQQQIPTYEKLYGGPTVSTRTLDQKATEGQSAYIAILSPTGAVIAHSRGFTAQAEADLKLSAALALVRTGHPYALGNVLPYGSSHVLEFAVALPSRYGRRILLTGVRPVTLSGFLASDLREIPGVRGAHNYVIDGSDTVLASTNPARPAGYRFSQPGQVDALGQSSGDRNGHYYVVTPLANSTWRIVLAAPNGPLFASVSGVRKWVPWLIFAAFAIVALLALALARRTLGASAAVREANARLELLNGELASTNANLERRAAELARSNGELEQFASIASHDLQEPLRKIRTFTQRLTEIEAERLSDTGRDYLQRSNSAAERMQKLIADLLRFSRVATHGRPFAPVDLEQVTREVLVDLEDQVERSGATVHVGELPTISADALQMRQLIQNLVSNALKFRRPGVTPEVSIDGSTDGATARIVVRDNGIGFEDQYSRRIFRVFERLHGRNDYPGTGIGLALCRKIAERHGGTIVAESAPGVGSTFTVTVPMHQAEEVVVPAAPSDHEAEREPEAARAT
jgi:signal transduction histidine kinase